MPYRALRLAVFGSNPFEPVTLFSTAKNRVTRKMPPLLKFLTAKKAVAEPPKKLSTKSMLLSYLLTYPRIYVRQLFVRFRRAIYMDVN
ncbi:MAG: hypothetical protein ACJASL_002635 [Paraglaciecola sp.]|jgi:hypothetical protein